MALEQLSTLLAASVQQATALDVIDLLLAYYRAWREERQKIHLHITYDFVLDDAGRERTADMLEQALVLTDVLRLVATIIEEEAEDTTDLLYDWLYD